MRGSTVSLCDLDIKVSTQNAPSNNAELIEGFFTVFVRKPIIRETIQR